MSAAVPLPPPGPPSGMNGYPHSHDGWRGSNGAGDGRGTGGAHPPLAQIQASASDRVDSMRTLPIQHLFDAGRQHFNNAKFQLDRRTSPSAAYWDYLVSYQIIADAIPTHRDFVDKIKTNRSHLYRDFNQLLNEINSMDDRFTRIREIILNDNKRAGVHSQSVTNLGSRPSSASSQYSTRTEGSKSQGSRLSNGSFVRRDDELMLPDVPTVAPGSRAPPSAPFDAPRSKPQVQPKPQSLHGRALHHSTASANGSSNVNDLAERFAKLRGAAVPLDTSSSAHGHEGSLTMPSPSEYHSTSRPQGPRDMPPPSSVHSPPRPPKLPLNTQLAASLPKEPSPTYSPARNMALPNGINAPRSSARSIVGTGGRSNSLASSVSAYPPGANGETDSYFPEQTRTQEPQPLRRKSTTKPLELQIPAEKLYDYLQMYHVLLIDVRSREEYDSGHIFSNAIMCIEPTALEDGSSAEQLYDRLVLSPDEEQAMFDRRNEYDLVVYYDERTKTNAFLNKHNPNERERALKRMYDTLYEFNVEKPLRRPPIFLMGGIDAWTDVVGPQALAMTTTATLVAGGQVRQDRTIRRSPAVTRAGRGQLRKHRMRDYTTMDPEEERRWMDEARRGRAVFESAEDDEDAESLMYRTTEDFLRRFPEVEMEQQSMVYPPPRPQMPVHAPPPVPEAPSRPAPSVPRMSYSGVHEREIATQGRANQLPVYVSPGRHGHMRLHRTGLINFGVTCYMNSILQCLSANMDLTNLFLSNQYTKNLQRENWKGTKGLLPEAYATLLSNLYKGDVGSLRPSTFRKLSGHFNSTWAIDEQQDAKEFLEFVLDCLHEDLNVTWNKPPLKQLTEAEEQKRESLPRPYVARIEWNRYLHRENSTIGQLFAGQHASRLTCTTCGNTSTTYEAFWSISVEIPRSGSADIRDCLRSYCSTERLSGDDIWRCPRCKQEREAMKKITITRAPDYLTVHFKRFSASRTESARKVRTPIHFPLQGLDLGPFMSPPMTEQEEAQILSTNVRDGAAQLTAYKTDPAMNGPFIYNAYAVIWHLGNTLGSGHYIAMVKDKSKGLWRSFNDDRITDFEPGKMPAESRLQSEKAYIVFYERERVAGGV
ncbi:hypothetical protein BDV96DRAFT_644478 [Lophiotrema nucula]|uniref:Ubiquitin carboxyl-terminal hydrolase 2 n=1 Tax=Lophiotrema nucula TaxID=690887 RepID=A0A6A5ZDQ2_9PLEO|nr:hypothetical protein BDV96DRAFT_644478 [Lophiotrema nucula]